MTHFFSYYGTIQEFWLLLYTEYLRLGKSLGHPPFEFEDPNHATINEYVPKDGDEIIIYFWDADHKHGLLVVEAQVVPDEDLKINIGVYPQGNAFEEPILSAMQIWKQIKNTIEKASLKPALQKLKRGMNSNTAEKLVNLREMRLEFIRKHHHAPAKTKMLGMVGLSLNTLKANDIELHRHWKDLDYE